MVGVRIRRLTTADWELLRALRQCALRQSPRVFLGDVARESAWSEGRWQLKCSDEYWFVADVGDVASGLANLARAEDGSDLMYIESMWVDPGHRLAGVGRALVRFLEAAALDLGESEIRLWVLRGNDAGRMFFERLGYLGPIKEQSLDVGTSRAGELEFGIFLGAAGRPGAGRERSRTDLRRWLPAALRLGYPARSTMPVDRGYKVAVAQ